MNGPLKMTSFKDFFVNRSHLHELNSPSISVSSAHSHQTLQLKFDAKDLIIEAAYLGKADPWLSSLCGLIPGLSLHQASLVDHSLWEEAFRDDQSYWEFRADLEKLIFFPALELLRAGLDIYRGRDYLYQESSHLICRCFGVREADVLNFLRTEAEPTLEKLSTQTKAGLGCRSCVPQLKRWLAINAPGSRERFFKERSHAEWLLEIDQLLSSFPLAKEWVMAIESFKQGQVIITYQKDVTQKEEEVVAGKIQGFLASGTDPDLAFFLRRTRQRSKAVE